MDVIRIKHDIKITHTRSACDTFGHTDVKINCSCGFERLIPHGERKDAETPILYHRIQVIEEALGIKINVEWTR